MINCKESTRLTIKKEENKITLRERIELSFHLMMCKFCSAFNVQNSWINGVSKHAEAHDSFSESEKQDLEVRMKDSTK
jgi:hypothetical protein